MKRLKIFTLLILLLSNVNQLLAQQNTDGPVRQRITYISGKIDGDTKYDTLSLVIPGPFFHEGAPEIGARQVLTTTADKNGEFKFKLLTENSPFHISLFLSKKRNAVSGLLAGNANVPDYLIEPGDSIHIHFDKYGQYYSGKGASLCEAQYKVAQTDKNGNILTHDDHDSFNTDMEKWLRIRDSILNVQLEVLSRYQSKLSPAAYGIVRADIIGVNRAFLYRIISFGGAFFVPGTPLDPHLADLCKELRERPAYINQSDRAALSPKYIYYLFAKLRIEVKYDRIMRNESIYLNNNYFPMINQQYEGMLRDKLLAYWLTWLTAFQDLQPAYLTNALSVMETPVFIQMVNDLKMTYTKGQPVIDFDFKDAKDKTVHLADLKGKVLLIDLWFSGCHGCVAVAAGLPAVESAFKGNPEVAFVSISIDKDKKIWLQSIDKNPAGKLYTHYTTPTTIYLYTGGTAADNLFIKRYVPSGSYPSLLIIGKEGNIFSSTAERPITQKGKEALINEITEALNDN